MGVYGKVLLDESDWWYALHMDIADVTTVVVIYYEVLVHHDTHSMVTAN